MEHSSIDIYKLNAMIIIIYSKLIIILLGIRKTSCVCKETWYLYSIPRETQVTSIPLLAETGEKRLVSITRSPLKKIKRHWR